MRHSDGGNINCNLRWGGQRDKAAVTGPGRRRPRPPPYLYSASLASKSLLTTPVPAATDGTGGPPGGLRTCSEEEIVCGTRTAQPPRPAAAARLTPGRPPPRRTPLPAAILFARRPLRGVAFARATGCRRRRGGGDSASFPSPVVGRPPSRLAFLAGQASWRRWVRRTGTGAAAFQLWVPGGGKLESFVPPVPRAVSCHHVRSPVTAVATRGHGDRTPDPRPGISGLLAWRRAAMGSGEGEVIRSEAALQLLL